MNRSEGLRVEEVASGKGFRDFLDLPYRLCAGDPNWVPPLRVEQSAILDRAKHPFYQHAQAKFFVAYRGDRAVGRIAAISDDVHNQTHHETTTHFGFFECVDDRAVAAALFEAVEATSRGWGHNIVRGPFNPSVNEEIGLQIDAFDRPSFVLIPNNPPWYPPLVEAAGYAKCMDLFCFYAEAGDRSAQLSTIAAAARRRGGFRYRKITRKGFDADVEAIWQIYNKAWARNWFWVPATEGEFRNIAERLKQIADFDLGIIAETEDGEPAGVCIAIPNIYEATIKVRDGRLLPFGLPSLLWNTRPGAIRSARVMIMGVLDAYRRKGVDIVMIDDLVTTALRKGYDKAEMSQILETNTPMIHIIERMGGRRYKTHRMYEKRLA